MATARQTVTRRTYTTYRRPTSGARYSHSTRRSGGRGRRRR